MSHQNIESRVKPRRIDAPHSVGSAAEQAPSRVPELAAAGSRSVPVRRAMPAEVSVPEFDSAMDLGERAGDSSYQQSSLHREKEAELSALAASLAQREEQLDHQSAQLAGQLQEQLRELEQRESQLNARAADLDNEFRQARLWAEEQLASLRERESNVAAQEAKLEVEKKELKLWQEQAEQSLVQKEILAGQRLSEQLQQHEERHREVESRERALQKKEAEFAGLQQEILGREQQLESKEAHIRERRQFIEREAAALHHARQEWERSHEADRDDLEKQRGQIRQELVAAIKGREEALGAGESSLAEQTLALEKDRQSLSRERADWQRQKGADREAIALLHSRTEVELEHRRTRLTTRETALDQQQAALDQLRGEITTAHRQSIEMRLMAEQLWAQVQGRMPPLEITQSIAQLRLKLGEQYKMEQQSLGEQKQELLKLAEKVAQQSTELRTQRHELQSWFASREAEIERHAEALVVRERELLEQSDNLRESENRWNSDRRQLEQELRDLRSRLRPTAA